MHTFTYTPDPENHFDHVKATVETKSVMLTDVVAAFEAYLHAAGFIFEGHLDFVEDEPRAGSFEVAPETYTGTLGSSSDKDYADFKGCPFNDETNNGND